MESINFINLLVGTPLLVLGRRLFWLFVGGLGFVGGLMLAPYLLQNQPGWTYYALAAGLGVIGALLATFVQRLAIIAAGFAAGAYLTVNSISILGLNIHAGGNEMLVAGLAGGVLGAVLMMVLFDAALTIISSLVGALLIARAFPLNDAVTVLVIVILFLIGLRVQRKIKKSPPLSKASE